MMNQGWSASNEMNRWPTVPVAPRTPTLTVFVSSGASSCEGADTFGAEKWEDDFDLDMVAQIQIRAKPVYNHHHPL